MLTACRLEFFSVNILRVERKIKVIHVVRVSLHLVEITGEGDSRVRQRPRFSERDFIKQATPDFFPKILREFCCRISARSPWHIVGIPYDDVSLDR
jgi:hypothetical protein